MNTHAGGRPRLHPVPEEASARLTAIAGPLGLRLFFFGRPTKRGTVLEVSCARQGSYQRHYLGSLSLLACFSDEDVRARMLARVATQ